MLVIVFRKITTFLHVMYERKVFLNVTIFVIVFRTVIDSTENVSYIKKRGKNKEK